MTTFKKIKTSIVNDVINDISFVEKFGDDYDHHELEIDVEKACIVLNDYNEYDGLPDEHVLEFKDLAIMIYGPDHVEWDTEIQKSGIYVGFKETNDDGEYIGTFGFKGIECLTSDKDTLIDILMRHAKIEIIG